MSMKQSEGEREWDQINWRTVIFAVCVQLMITGAASLIRESARERMVKVCPDLLAAASTLTDSLAVAQQYDECEWWTASPEPLP